MRIVTFLRNILYMSGCDCYSTLAFFGCVVAELSHLIPKDRREHILKSWRKLHLDKIGKDVEHVEDSIKAFNLIEQTIFGTSDLDGESIRLVGRQMLDEMEPDDSRALAFIEMTPHGVLDDHLQLFEIVGVQEVRAHQQQLVKTLRSPPGWSTHFTAAKRPGYSGTALYSHAGTLHAFAKATWIKRPTRPKTA